MCGVTSPINPIDPAIETAPGHKQGACPQYGPAGPSCVNAGWAAVSPLNERALSRPMKRSALGRDEKGRGKHCVRLAMHSRTRP